eukprot:CAMPEP_0204512846 /NCGR_PEP_ID=MMETSP0661-20131031/1175_1 /ASSEMBLY_ACC=CAM_ASM_000606 /TAXON_ID=109239 /ORGANISM="Alexandrium margalefi, Strain AMGDE01CS-322" /LENGTH=368 /DNA_ID=CAMNT_0051517981 /DNA_START=95 /DNA_END=1201 /DNA_ORIENTATION=+
MAPDPGGLAGGLLLQLVAAHVALVNMLLAFSDVRPPAAASPSTTSSYTPTSAPTSAMWPPPSSAPRATLCLYDRLGLNECIPNGMKTSALLVRPGVNESVLGDVKASCMTKCNPDGDLALVASLPRVNPAGAHPGDFAAGASATSCLNEGFHVMAPCMNMNECLSDGVQASTTNECSNVLNGVTASTMNVCSNVLKSPCTTECLPDGVRATCMNACLPDGALASGMNECLPDGVLTSDINECSSDEVMDPCTNVPSPDYATPCSEEDDMLNPHFEAFMDSLTLDEFKVWESDAYDAYDYVAPSPSRLSSSARKRRPAKKKSFNESMLYPDKPSCRSDGYAAKKMISASNINVAAGSAAPCTGPPRALL